MNQKGRIAHPVTGHAAASLNQDGSTKIRSLDKGLDPAVPVKTKKNATKSWFPLNKEQAKSVSPAEKHVSGLMSLKPKEKPWVPEITPSVENVQKPNKGIDPEMRSNLAKGSDLLGSYIDPKEPSIRAMEGERYALRLPTQYGGAHESLTPGQGLFGTIASGAYARGSKRIVYHTDRDGNPSTWEVLQWRPTGRTILEANEHDWVPMTPEEINRDTQLSKILDHATKDWLQNFKKEKYTKIPGRTIE